MSGKLIDLRRRIKSIGNTQKITRAMKSVSAAKLKKSVVALNKSNPYLIHLERIINRLAIEMDISEHPFFQNRTEGIDVFVVVSADKGLCGAFNSRIYRETLDIVHEYQQKNEEILLITVGKKICHFTRDRILQKDR